MAPPSPPPPPGAKTRLVVLFGGQSAEHDVSRVTARHVVAALDHDRFEVVPVGITRDGSWVVAESAGPALLAGDAALAIEPLPDALAVDGPEVDPLPLLGGRASTAVGAAAPATVVLPLLHGPMGEDGTVQGLLELAGVPYVGSGVLGSALAMDKIAAKHMTAALGIHQARWRGLHRSEVVDRSDPHGVRPELVASLVQELGFPMFVKPANMGSSIGVTRAADEAGLVHGLRAALDHDEWLVVEEGIVGREIEVAVLGHTESPRASVPGEIVPGSDFYDYDDKYALGTAELRIPAPLSPERADAVRELACRVFTGLRGSGMARVDFFLADDGRGFLLNEMNTIPGFTPISMFPRLWMASGLTYRSLLDELIALAVERHAAKGATHMSWGSMEPSVVLDGLAYPESLRWRDGRLWFSDVHDGRIWAMTEDGQAEPVVRVVEQPGGLGWLPDGRLLVVSMRDHALLRLDDEGLIEVCDLERFSPHPWNDMAVTADGRAYIGNYGYDAERGDEPAGARMVCVEPDGEAWVVAEQMLFPNGSVVLTTPGDALDVLLVAETFGQRISAYDLEPDGSLSNPRVWADLRPNVPDGICLDVEGALWVADPVYNGLMRVLEHEGVVEWVPTGQRSVYSCALGGSDGQTLFMCTGQSTNPAKTMALRSGHIEAVRVGIPAPGF